MDSITLKAPAKVNLFLDVIGKRKDGYHDIVTVFERINLFDTIYIAKKTRPGISVSCDGDIPTKDNLAYKAARLILSGTKSAKGVHIRIKKNIPIAAGLGGGSSDAASVLLGINKLFRLGYNKKKLMGLARSIGADVSFFILERNFAVGEKRGDKLKSLYFKTPKLWHLIVYPGVKTLTKEIYGSLRLGLTTKKQNVRIMLHALRMNDFGLIKEATYNRLEDPALDRDPGLGIIKSKMTECGMERPLLSGSGPSIFGITKTRKEATLLKEKILRGPIGVKTDGWQTFIISTFE